MPVLAALFAALGPWIARFFMLKGVLMFSGFLGRLGIVLATNEFVMQPLIQHAINAWSQIPGDMQCWLSIVGVVKVASIIVTGTSLLGAKRVFFSKA